MAHGFLLFCLCWSEELNRKFHENFLAISYILWTQSPSIDSLAEWSKAPDLGSGPRGRGFKSHSCHVFYFCN